MITAGIDMGSKTIKVVILRDKEIIGRCMMFAGFENRVAAELAFTAALSEAGITMEEVDRVVGTGAGRNQAPFVERSITEVGSDVKGVMTFYPSARTVIDVGAEEGRAIRCNEWGKVLDFALNEKCAAGAGAFTEAMSRALEVDLEKLGQMSLKSQKAIPMNAQCAVFAESEVVSLLHAKVAKEDIARAVHDAIASRIVSLARKVGFEPDVVLIGGVAHNVGFVASLKKALDCEVIIPEDPDYIGAYGAAVAAEEELATA
jgi:benzoyl-CoA reductase subunit D